MRILIHDYSGHAFILELARKLAAQGHDVLHLYSASFLTPQGDTGSGERDAPTFKTIGLVLPEQVDKTDFVKRWKQDKQHGQLVCKEIEAFKPDVVVCANTPLESLRPIQKLTRQLKSKFVFWCQDINGIAIKAIVGSKIPVVGNVIGDYFIRMEAKLLRDSDVIIAISEDFNKVFDIMHITHSKVFVLPNWAPLDQLPAVSRQNPWSNANGLDDSFVFLYSGTLGFKHNPNLLLKLAESFKGDPKVVVQVISGGKAVEWLVEQAAEKGLTRLRTLPFQPFGDLPNVFGSADVLLAILESSASEFSVPSKVLAYLCAARPLLLAVPISNLVARTVDENGAGFVVAPDDEKGFVERAHTLYADAKLRQAQGTSARSYAEKTFDIEHVSEMFLRYIQS